LVGRSVESLVSSLVEILVENSVGRLIGECIEYYGVSHGANDAYSNVSRNFEACFEGGW